MTTLNIKISTQNPKTMIYTTLNRIREHSPCVAGWKRLIRHLGPDFPMDSPFPLVEILNAEGEGLDDCLWALRAEPQHAQMHRLYAVRRARSVQHLMKDPRSIAAIDVAERHAHGNVTDDELAAAWDAAFDVTWGATRDAAWDAAWAAAWAVAGDEARATVCDAPLEATWAAARAAAGAAARVVAGDAARAAVCDAASTDLREMLTSHHAMPDEPAL